MHLLIDRNVTVIGVLRDGSTREDKSANSSTLVGSGSKSVPIKIFKGIENRIEIRNKLGSLVKTFSIPSDNSSSSLSIEF